MKYFTFLCCFVVFQAMAQTSDLTKETMPIRLDQETMSGLNLERVYPSWAALEREMYTKSLFSGQSLIVNVSSSNTAAHFWENYSIDEFVLVLNGQAVITAKAAEPNSYNKDDYFFVPKGFTGTWKTVGGAKYYLELAVYSRNRANSMMDHQNRNSYQIDPLTLSGVGQIPRTRMQKLIDGAELKVSTVHEESGSKTYEANKSDELYSVLTGKVTVTNKQGERAVFLVGDKFVVPVGFSGRFQYDGHDGFRALVVSSF